MLSNSPGGVNFESNAFKLTSDFVEVMGGPRSQAFRKFKSQMVKGFLALRKNAEEIISFVEMTMVANKHLACFSRGRETILNEL